MAGILLQRAGIARASLYIVHLLCLFLFLTAQFTEDPMSVERAEGLEAVFSCQYQEEGLTVTYDWAINNSLVSIDTETVRARRPSSPGEPATLTILATPQHNNSVVQCVATIRNGIVTVRSEISTTATLTVHGELVTIIYVRFCRHFPRNGNH